GLTPLAPVRLADCAPLKNVVPGPQNVRRRNLETYFHPHGVVLAAMLEMDAMIGTLEFVARSDWVTVLPSLICINDIGKGDLVVNPIINPTLRAEFVVIQPARRTLSLPARRFLECFEAQVANIHARWERALTAVAANGRRARNSGVRQRALSGSLFRVGVRRQPSLRRVGRPAPALSAPRNEPRRNQFASCPGSAF